MNSGLDFVIVGGIVKVPSRVMAMEMLKKDSILRTFVLCSKQGGKQPRVTKDEKGIIIDFTGAEVPLNCGPQDAFDPIKRKYKGQITGSVTCQMKYSMMSAANFTTVHFEED